MADSGQPKAADRRTFLKIGAGVVAGAAIATVVEVPYYSSVMGGDSSSSSSTVSSLKSQLSSTQEQLSSTAAQLNAAQGQVTSLNNQLSSTAAQLTSANSQLSGVNTQLSSTQQALTSANGQISALNGQVSSLGSQVTTLNGQITSLNSAVNSANSQASLAQAQATALQIHIDTTTAIQTLGVKEQSLVEAIAETIIPSDSNGPGAKDAGVIYFIDGQLAGKYGNNGEMYMRGPFVAPNISSAVTVNGVTYTGGTMSAIINGPQRYQYDLIKRDYWRLGLLALQAYANSAYGGNFETLSAANQVAVLTDLYNNKPTSFNNILPQDFFYELYFMTWAGFLTDPMYGGNKGMIGWTYEAFNGLNQGNFYGEGHTSQSLMVATTPTALQPASLGQFQKGSP